MELSLPNSPDLSLSSADAAMYLAIGMFVSDDATLGQAAKTAGLSQTDFLRELGRLRIPIHYGMEEMEADLLTVGELVG